MIRGYLLGAIDDVALFFDHLTVDENKTILGRYSYIDYKLLWKNKVKRAGISLFGCVSIYSKSYNSNHGAEDHQV